VQWAALGIGIAWVVSLIRVLQAVVVAGGLAAFILWLRRRDARRTDDGSTTPSP
jgi:Flp pilus assembly protein TadB